MRYFKTLWLVPVFALTLLSACGESEQTISDPLPDQNDNEVLLASSLVDQQQLSGGDEYRFTRLNKNTGRVQTWAEQSFVPTRERITRIELGLFFDIDACTPTAVGVYSICVDDDHGNNMVCLSGNELCWGTTRAGYNGGGLERFDVDFTVTPGDRYYIKVTDYDENTCETFDPTCYWTYLRWGRSTGNEYANGSSKTVYGTSSSDFVFKVWGYTPEPVCNEEITCDPTARSVIRKYPGNNCGASPITLETCSSDEVCEFSACVYRYPQMNIEGFNSFKNADYSGSATSYLPGDQINFKLSTKNYGKSGTYSATFKIYQGTTLKDSWSSSDRSIDVAYATDYVSWDKAIPADWVGDFILRAEITECPADKICFMEKHITVNVPCLDGDGDGYFSNCEPFDCNDGLSTLNEPLSCSYNGSACGNYSICSHSCPTTPAEICNGMDDDCDDVEDEGFDLQTDINNCGVCGYRCDSEQNCVNGACVSALDLSGLDDDMVAAIDTRLFVDIAHDLLQQRRVNEIFFQDFSEDDAEKSLVNILAGFESHVHEGTETLSDVVSLVELSMPEFKQYIQYELAINLNRVRILQGVENGEGVAFFYYAEDSLDLTLTAKRIVEVNKWKKALEGGGKILDGGLALYYGITHGDGDLGKTIVYTAGEYLYRSALPHMVVLGAVKTAKDFAFGIVGIDPSQITCNLSATGSWVPFSNMVSNAECGFWLTNGVIDVMTSLDVAEAADGECGVLNGNIFVCVNKIGDGLQLLSHPAAYIEAITPIVGENYAQFEIDVKNYFNIAPLFNDLWIGATVLSDDLIGCNYDLAPQPLTLGAGEEKVIRMDWGNVPPSLQGQSVGFVSKIWYHCADCSQIESYRSQCNILNQSMCDKVTACESFEPSYSVCGGSSGSNFVCFGDALENLGYALSGRQINFSLVRKVNFADPKVQSKVKSRLSISESDDVTVEDMSRLNSLAVRDEDVENLRGLESAINLNNIDVWNNQIEDLSPLSGLEELSEAFLRSNRIADLTPLEGLANLRDLYLGDNLIEDISPLTGLTGLEKLDLGENTGLNDLTQLEVLTQLDYLSLAGNWQYYDLTPLSGLIALEELRLHANQIRDVSPLRGLTRLKKLYLSFNMISDISPLERMSQLTELNLKQNRINDIAALSRMKARGAFSSGSVINLEQNPLGATENAKNISRGIISELCSAGVKVKSDLLSCP